MGKSSLDSFDSLFHSCLEQMVSAEDLRGLAEAFYYAIGFLNRESSIVLDKIATAILQTMESLVASNKKREISNAITNSEISGALRDSLNNLYSSVSNKSLRMNSTGKKPLQDGSPVPLSAFERAPVSQDGPENPFTKFLPLGEQTISGAFGNSQNIPNNLPRRDGSSAFKSLGAPLLGGTPEGYIIPKKKLPSPTIARKMMVALLKKLSEQNNLVPAALRTCRRRR